MVEIVTKWQVQSNDIEFCGKHVVERGTRRGGLSQRAGGTDVGDSGE